MVNYQTITIEREAPIATVTLNRPDVLNALNLAMLGELHAAFDALDDDDAIRAVVLTGSGDRAFAAGADIGELSALSSAVAGAELARRGQGLTLAMERMRKPVIVAVNGFALGGGCELAMGGDILIASDKAKFGQPEVNLGLIPGYGGTQRTARLAGRGAAMLLCLAGEMIDANEACRLGIVQKVVPHAQLMEEAKRISLLIASKAPLAVAAAKRVIADGLGVPLAQGLALEALAFGSVAASADAKEGTAAFLAKRRPEFKGS